jgi:hypothetical protein
MDDRSGKQITIEKIINELCRDQETIPDDYNFGTMQEIISEQKVQHIQNSILGSMPLPNAFDDLFNTSNLIYYPHSFTDVHTFIRSLLTVTIQEFVFYSKSEQRRVVDETLNTIKNNININDLHKKLKYQRKKGLKRNDLYNGLSSSNIDQHAGVLQYISDYYNFNIIVFKMEGSDIIKNIEIINSNRDFKQTHNPFITTIIMIQNDHDQFCPIVHEEHNHTLYQLSMDDDNILYQIYKHWHKILLKNVCTEYAAQFPFNMKPNNLKPSGNISIIENNINNDDGSVTEDTYNLSDIPTDHESKTDSIIESESKPESVLEIEQPIMTTTEYNKLTRPKLQKMCTQRSINTHKVSDKTNKPIMKIKSELIKELVDYDNNIVNKI